MFGVPYVNVMRVGITSLYTVHLVKRVGCGLHHIQWYNRFSSTCAVYSILEKRYGVLKSPEKVLEFFLSNKV